MAYISQASSPVSDFNKFVISALVRAPQATIDAGSGAFLEFGQTTEGPSGLFLGVDGIFHAQFMGAHDGYNYTYGGSPSANTTAQAFALSSTGVVVGATWKRVICSGDFSSGASFTFNAPGDFTVDSNDFRLWLSVDDTDYSSTQFPDPSGTNHTGKPAGSFIPSIGLVLNSDDVVYPAFSIKTSGLEFAMPCLAANADPAYNGKFEMADFLMWTGVSLNTSVTDNRRLFIDADGRPVNPSTAIATLGTPVYDLRGPVSNIGTNGGSAGNLTKTGTVTNFMPGP